MDTNVIRKWMKERIEDTVTDNEESRKKWEIIKDLCDLVDKLKAVRNEDVLNEEQYVFHKCVWGGPAGAKPSCFLKECSLFGPCPHGCDKPNSIIR